MAESDIHTCSEHCPCQTGGQPVPDFLAAAAWPPPLCAVCGKDAATHLGFTRVVTCGQFQQPPVMPNISGREATE